MELTRICEFCNSSFTAQTVKTRYCSHICNSRHYKVLKREEKIRLATAVQSSSGSQEISHSDVGSKPYLSVQESASILGTSRRTIERLIHSGQIKAAKLGRRTIISRQALDNLFQS